MTATDPRRRDPGRARERGRGAEGEREREGEAKVEEREPLGVSAGGRPRNLQHGEERRRAVKAVRAKNSPRTGEKKKAKGKKRSGRGGGFP